MQTMTMRAHLLPVEGSLPSLTGATAWLNSQPRRRSIHQDNGQGERAAQ
jgi:hypothetical protein